MPAKQENRIVFENEKSKAAVENISKTRLGNYSDGSKKHTPTAEPVSSHISLSEKSSKKKASIKSETFTLPDEQAKESQHNNRRKSDSRPKKQSITHNELPSSLKGDRLRLYKEAKAQQELDDEYVEKLIADHLEAEEKRNKYPFLEKLKNFAAKTDVFAAAHTIPKHQICIFVAAAMIPLSLITITWDLLAAIVFEIPHLSTINAPAFILVINFMAMPLAMYGYMMEYLMHENSRETIIGLICVIVHPMLFFIRAYMEYHFDGFRNERKLYFENPKVGQPFEYPIGVLP